MASTCIVKTDCGDKTFLRIALDNALESYGPGYQGPVARVVVTVIDREGMENSVVLALDELRSMVEAVDVIACRKSVVRYR